MGFNPTGNPHPPASNSRQGYTPTAVRIKSLWSQEVIDEETWAIRYLIIDTQNWWPGKKVLVSPQWIDSVSWNEAKVFVNLARDTIKQAPEYTDWSLLTRGFEIDLHKYYDRQGYWDAEPANTVNPR